MTLTANQSPMTSLSVGCGEITDCDVNVDLYIKDTAGHRVRGDNTERYLLDPHSTPNFVLADAQHLPFKDNCFDWVESKQVIEHVPDPVLMLQELVRVSSDRVLVECPHWASDMLGGAVDRKYKRWAKTHHVNRFRARWFKVMATRLNCRVVRCELFGETYFPHPVLRLITVANCIRVEYAKK